MKRLWLVLSLLVLASLALAACGPAPIEKGSKLICPKNYDPGVSVCTEKQTANESYDANTKQELDAVLLGVGEVGIYRKDAETYGIYDGPGYHPTPSGSVIVYSKKPIRVVSDVKESECGGYDNYDCVGGLNNVTLMGVNNKFDASYVLDIAFDFSTQENLRLLYEVGGPVDLMAQFNDRSRDTLRDSTDIDPQKLISGEMKRMDVAKIWLNKLKTSDDMTSWKYFKLFTFNDVSVRYFEPHKESSDSESSSQAVVDQEFQDFLRRRDLFCAQYEPGSSLRAECDRTFVCSQTDKVCYFGGAIIPVDQLPTATPTPNP